MSSRPHSRTRLSTRFLVSYAVVYVVLILAMGVIVERTARAALLAGVDDELELVARLAQQTLPADRDGYDSWAETVSEATGLRLTLIGIDGSVVADSHSDPAVMGDHSTREEFVKAIAGETGRAQRVSGSTGFEQRYVALPPAGDVVVRTSVPTRVVDDDLGAVRRSIGLTAAALGMVGVVVVALLAGRISRPIIDLTRQARAAAAGEDVSPRRSPVRELDQLGVAIATMAEDLGNRLRDATEATATLETVLGGLPAGTLLIDSDDRVVYSNRMAARLLGVVPDHLAGLSPLTFQEAVREARQERGPVSGGSEHGAPARILHATATPFAGDRRVLLVVSDVTARERADAMRRDFVANASHELKTPVSTIIASAEALQIALERDDGTAAGFAQRIETSARQLERLVSDLLDLSRIEREIPDKSMIRLDVVVKEEVERASDATRAKGVVVEVSAEPLELEASARDVAVAVRNLLDNAIRHTPAGGSISVVVAAEDGQAVVRVTDTGEGIPSRDLERIFERFYRVDSARSRATGGTGLGLAIVKHVAESHGGSVSVRSELGAGSSFEIRFPLRSEGAVAERN